MKRTKPGIVFCAVTVAIAACALAGGARAQNCSPASHSWLYFIVRDNKGKVVDPAAMVEASTVGSGEKARALKREDVRQISLPDNTKVNAIWFDGNGCRAAFAGEMTLRRGSKTMRLIINRRAGLGFGEHIVNVVDSAPFQQGTFKLVGGKWEKVASSEERTITYKLVGGTWEKVSDEVAEQ